MVDADGAAVQHGPEVAAVEQAVEHLVAADADWSSGTPVDLGDDIRWTPDAVRAGAVLHVHLADRVRPYILERMRRASALGLHVHIALTQSALYDEALLEVLSPLDVRIELLETDGGVRASDTLLNLIAGARNGRRPAIRVSPSLRRVLASDGWKLAAERDVPADVKGRRLEGLLAFLLSQVQDFEVVERNLRTDTEELDIVVAQRATHGRCWTTLGAPFILVECKNWSAKVQQVQLSGFRVKMLGRRSAVRLGLMVGANGFTSDAFDQELRFAEGDITIALIGPEELTRWIDADPGDDELEAIVRWAMLR